MKRTLTSRLLLLVLALVMVVGLGTSALAQPNIPGNVTGPFSLTIHHSIQIDPFTGTPGTVVGAPPSPQGTPVVGSLWQIQRVDVPATFNQWNLEGEALANALIAAGTVADTRTANTGATGQAVFNDTSHATPLPGGFYVVRELLSTPITTEQELLHPPFVVSLPFYTPGTGEPRPPGTWTNNVHVFTKQAFRDIDDDFFYKVNRSGEAVNVGNIMPWSFYLEHTPGLATLPVIRVPGTGVPPAGPVTGLPAITTAMGAPARPHVRIVDLLDERLRLQGDIIVEFYTATGWQALTSGWAHNATMVGTRQQITVDILEAGRNTIATNGVVGEGNIRVRFDTMLQTGAATGAIDNTGRLYFGEQPPFDPEDPTDGGFVFQLRLTKTDMGDTPLQNARFRLYTTLPGGARGPAVMDPANPATVLELTTNAQGLLTFTGLVPGVYYLYEVQAPAGFLRDPAHRQITISNAHTVITWSGTEPPTNTPDHFTVPLRVHNTPETGNWQLPMTGGAGTLIFTLVGLSLIGGSVVLLLVFKKRNDS